MIKYKHLNTILALTKTEFWSIIIYSSIVGLFSLIIPIAAQGLVNFVSFGRITQPLVILGFAVFIALAFAGVFRILQMILVENIQQRVFAYNSINLAKNIPNLKINVFEDYRGTELTNRFFDLFTIQKTLSLLLISGAGLVLQAIFGMVLLAFYHPFLLVFDIILLFALTLVIWLPWKSALQTALNESDAKYEVAGWLEELARLPLFFKFNRYNKFAFETADQKIANYLTSRQSHFSKLLAHIIGTHFIQIVGITSLLILGGLLVINNQLTLGQLVAAEIVVSAIGSSAVMFSKYLEDIYDLLAAAKKVDFLLDLPLEENEDFNHHNQYLKIISEFQTAPAISVNRLKFIKNDGTIVFNELSFSVQSRSHLVVYGENGSGKTLLTRLIVGLCMPTIGEIFYNSIDLCDYSLKMLRAKIAYINGIEFFDGTIIDNLILNQKKVDLANVWQILEQFKLAEKIRQLPKSIHTVINDNHHNLTDTDFYLLMIVRAILSNPYLIIMDEIIDTLPKQQLYIVIELLLCGNNPWTLILTTKRQDIADQFQNRVSL